LKILYLHQYFCTPKGSGGVRSYEFARRWVEAGHEVFVVTGMSAYDTSLPANAEIMVEGIRVRTLGVQYSTKMGSMCRLWAFFQYAVLSSWYAVRAKDFDLVLATSTPLTIAIPALIAKAIAQLPLVFEVRDVWPDAAVDAGVLKKGILYQSAHWLEMTAYRKSDHIVALSDGMVNRIASKGVPIEKIEMLPNCCDIEHFDPPRFDRGFLRQEFGVDDEFVLLYAGAINTANDMPFLVKCIDALEKNQKVKWWFVGGGNQLAYLKSEVEQLNVGNVKFWGKKPKSEMPKFVHAADAGVVSFINRPVYYENSPNKFFDYIAGGLPPIFTRSTWLKPYLEQHHAALICENNAVDEFVTIVKHLMSDAEYCDRIRTNVLELAHETFSRNSVSSHYIKLLETVFTNRCETHN
jgi:glycosyltransferase involved in cell wall biosynthesis